MKKKAKSVKAKIKGSKVSFATINLLNPCQARLDNYVKHYGAKEFTVKQFLALKKITCADKLWVALRVLPEDTVVKIAAEIAKSVLRIYESKYPGDRRVRDCIEATLAGTVTLEQRSAAYAAAYAANAAAYAAAYAAANAAAYAAANAANAAAYAAAYAAAADAAAAAHYAAAADAADAYAAREKARITQNDVNLAIVAKYWK